jgi:hypothetical protein
MTFSPYIRARASFCELTQFLSRQHATHQLYLEATNLKFKFSLLEVPKSPFPEITFSSKLIATLKVGKT